jgi:hypothetical protein
MKDRILNFCPYGKDRINLLKDLDHLEHELMDGFIMRDEGFSSHVALVRDAYNPKRRIYCASRGRMCWVALAMNCNAVNVWVFPLKNSLSGV